MFVVTNLACKIGNSCLIDVLVEHGQHFFRRKELEVGFLPSMLHSFIFPFQMTNVVIDPGARVS